ncbi:MAG: hypothetical protein ACTSWR_06410 [Candidatus Helarchaeota archaeon]
MSLEDEIKELEEQLAKKKSEVKELEEKLEQLRAKTQGAKPKTVLGVPINTSGTGTKKKVIQQRIPTSGTSQIKYRETSFQCPQCGSYYNIEIDDKSRILYIDGAGTRIYGKKHRCLNCGNEFR